jgi:hypothetical protein
MPTLLRTAEQTFSMMEAFTTAVMPGKVGNVFARAKVFNFVVFALPGNNFPGFAADLPYHQNADEEHLRLQMCPNGWYDPPRNYYSGTCLPRFCL